MQTKTILITGASRGIGRQLALAYAPMAVNLILIARDQNKLKKVAKECEALGANTITQNLDVRDIIAMKDFMLATDNDHPIDLVIANAGISSTLQPDWQEEKEENIQLTISSNVQGTLNTINPLISRMISRKKGHIVLVSSLAGLRGFPQSPSYSASKAMVHVYGQSLHAWLSRYQINVSVVYPGYVKTDMSDQLYGPKPFLISAEKAAKIIQKGILKRKAQILFPWQLRLLMKIASLLPNQMVNAILNRFESYAV